MSNYLHIASAVQGLLKVSDKDIYVGDKKIHMVCEQNFFASFNPTCDDYLPLNINIPLQNTNCVHVVPYCGNHYDILLMPRCKFVDIIYQQTYGKIDVIVYGNKCACNIIIKLEGLVKCNITTPPLNNISSTTNSFIIVNGDCCDGKYIVIIDENFNVVINNICKELEYADNCTKVLIDLNDSIGHGKVYNVYTAENKIDSYLVYMYNTPLPSTCNQLVPLSMLDCLMCGNTKQALQYFSDDITTQQLNDYFGNIAQYYYNVYDTNNINYTIITDSIKSYNFVVNDGKIHDIEEIDMKI